MKNKTDSSRTPGRIPPFRLAALLILIIAILLVAETIFTFAIMPAPHGGPGWASRPGGTFTAVFPVFLGSASVLLCLFICICMARTQFRSKLNLKRTGMILLHLGIPVMLAGYMAGKLGVDAEIRIPSGQDSNIIYMKDGKTERLDFFIRCDKFSMRFNKDGSPSEFLSYLSFIKDGRIEKRSVLRVNHPAGYEGFTLYQSGYSCEEKAIIKIIDSRRAMWVEAGEGDVIKLDSGVKIRTGHMISGPPGMGPVADLFVETPSGEYNIWLVGNLEELIRRIPDFLEIHPQFDQGRVKPLKFYLEDMNSSCTTVLSVRKDPGMSVVAAGAMIFAIGMVLVFIPRIKRQRG